MSSLRQSWRIAPAFPILMVASTLGVALRVTGAEAIHLRPVQVLHANATANASAKNLNVNDEVEVVDIGEADGDGNAHVGGRNGNGGDVDASPLRLDALPDDVLRAIAGAGSVRSLPRLRAVASAFRRDAVISRAEAARAMDWKNNEASATWPPHLRELLDEETGKPDLAKMMSRNLKLVNVNYTCVSTFPAVIRFPVWMQVRVSSENESAEVSHYSFTEAELLTGLPTYPAAEGSWVAGWLIYSTFSLISSANEVLSGYAVFRPSDADDSTTTTTGSDSDSEEENDYDSIYSPVALADSGVPGCADTETVDVHGRGVADRRRLLRDFNEGRARFIFIGDYTGAQVDDDEDDEGLMLGLINDDENDFYGPLLASRVAAERRTPIGIVTPRRVGVADARHISAIVPPVYTPLL